MFSTWKRCLIGIPIWGYQKFYSLSPKNWIFGPKTAKFGPKLAFSAKYRHFWPIWSNAWPKNNADKLPKWFSVMLVPKLLLTPIKIRIFGTKTAKFGPKLAFFCHFGQFDPGADQKTMQLRCIGAFSIKWVSKLLLPLIKIRIYGPLTAIFGPKYAFLVILGQILAFSAHLVPCPIKKQCKQGS